MTWVLDVLLKATLVLAATVVAQLLLRKAPAAHRHLAGVLGLGAALLVPGLAAFGPRLEVALLPAPRVLTTGPAPVAAGTAEASVPPRNLAAGAPVHAPAVGARAVETWAAHTSAARSEVVPPAPAPRPARLAVLGLAALAALGSLASLLRLLASTARAWRLRRDAEAAPESWSMLAATLAGEVGLTRRVPVLLSRDTPVALTTGVLRPVLVLPVEARRWSVERLRLVLLHELAHVARRDCLALLVAEVAGAAYWFHPLVWVASRQVRHDAEAASDDLVLAAGARPSDYAGELLDIARGLRARPALATVGMAMARPGSFEDRLRRILDPGRERDGLRVRDVAVGVAAAVLVAAALAAVQPWASGVTRADDEDDPAAPRALRSELREATKDVRQEVRAAHREVRRALRDVRRDVRQAAAELHDSHEVRDAVREVSRDVGQAVREALDAVHEALEEVSLATGHEPTTGRAWFSRGMRRHEDERWSEAADAFRKAVDAGYRVPTSAYNLACAYARMGDRDNAFVWLRRAADEGFALESYLRRDEDLRSLRGDPRLPELRRLAAARHADAHREAAASATRQMERLLGEQGRGAELFEVGRRLLRAGGHEAAARAFRAAAERGHRPGTSHYNAACALALAGQAGPALDLLARAVDDGYDDPGHMRRDADLDAIRDEPRFASILQTAETLSLSASTRGHRSSRSDRERHWREAAVRYLHFAQTHPESGRAWFNVGYARSAARDPRGAVAAYEKAIALGHRRATSMYNLACAHALAGDRDRAFEWLEKAVEAGFDGDHLDDDEDLDSLRDDPRFDKVLALADARRD